MCTVTFIPTGNACFITSNRDESPGRQAEHLTSLQTQDRKSIHYPLDELSGGSWIALSDTGRAVCLLNGAYESFIPNPPYRLSRGKVVMHAAQVADLPEHLEQYDLEGIAPFTLLVYENNSLNQMIWDGKERNVQSLPVDQPRIWSSVTLYPPEVRAWRSGFFRQWLKETKAFDRDSILEFHQQANGDPHNDFIMNRQNRVKTLSITSIMLEDHNGSILHINLEQPIREEILIEHGR